MRAPLSCTPKLRYLDYTVANAALKLLKETCRVRVRGVYVPCKNSSPHGRCGAFGGAVPAVRGVRYHTVPYIFTRPTLSGYLTKISETRIVKLR